MTTQQQKSPLYSFWLSIRLFYESGRLSYIALFRWLRPSTYIATKLVAPLASILFFTLIGIDANGPEAAGFFVIGNAMQMAAMNGIYGVSMSIGGDRWEGTLPYLFGIPGNRLPMFLGRAMFHLLDGSLGVIFGLFFGFVFFGLDFSQANLGLLLLTIAIASLGTAGLGLLLGALGLMTVNVMFVNNLFYFLLLVFSGANLDLTTMPMWVQTTSVFLPLTRSIRAARMVMEGAAFSDISTLLLTEIGLGAIYAVIGYMVFRRIETQARVKGTLEMA